MAVLRLGVNLSRRGPATAWEIYRLHTRREWLDHLVSDRFFSREELDQCCATLFPGCQLERLGGTVVGLTWDSTPLEARQEHFLTRSALPQRTLPVHPTAQGRH